MYISFWNQNTYTVVSWWRWRIVHRCWRIWLPLRSSSTCHPHSRWHSRCTCTEKDTFFLKINAFCIHSNFRIIFSSRPKFNTQIVLKHFLLYGSNIFTRKCDISNFEKKNQMNPKTWPNVLSRSLFFYSLKKKSWKLINFEWVW